MAATVEELLVRARMQDDTLATGLERDTVAARGLNTALKDVGGPGTTAALDRVEKRFNKLDAAVTGFAVRTVKRGLFGLGAMGAAATVFGLKTASGYEMSRIAFDTLLGSHERGRRLFAELQQLNIKTPFTLPEITGATQLLLRYGVAADQVLPTLHGLLDAAALSGNPTENLQRLALAVGQVTSQGRLLGQDARQLAESGINAYAIYAKATGKSMDEVRKLGEKGQLDSSVLLKAIQTETMGLENLRGGAEALSKTLFGQVSNLKDKLGYALAGATSPLAGLLKGEIGRVNDYLDDTNKRMGRFGPELGRQFKAGDVKGMADSLDKILGAGNQLEPVLSPALGVLKDLATITKQDLVPAARDISKIVVIGLRGLKDVTSWFANNPGAIKIGIDALLGFVALHKATSAVSGLTKGLHDLRTLSRDRGLLTAVQRIFGWNPGTVAGPGGKGVGDVLAGRGCIPVCPGTGGGLPGAGGAPTPVPTGGMGPPETWGQWAAKNIGGIMFAAGANYAVFQAYRHESAPSRVGHQLLPLAPGGVDLSKRYQGVVFDTASSRSRTAALRRARRPGDPDYDLYVARGLARESLGTKARVSSAGGDSFVIHVGKLELHAKDFPDFEKKLKAAARNERERN